MPQPGAAPHVPAPAALPPALRGELLDPAAWREGLEKYALAMHLAVALVDPAGRLLDPVVNPQPLWNQLRSGRRSGACPFALMPVQPCTCVADALTRGELVRARDRTGLVHFTVPLTLGQERLGALVAGQVFDQYPDQMVLEQAATKLGLSPTAVWQKARLAHPVGRSMLRVYEDLLATFAGHFLRGRYHALTEAARLAELTRLSEQLRQRTEDLGESNRRKDEFLAMLAHELRNPLAPIRNAAAVIRLAARGNADLSRAGETVERQVKHLVRLVDDLLDVSRINSGKIILRSEPTDLAAAASRSAEAARPAAEGRRQELSVALPRESLWVAADPVRLAQILGNLLHNAGKYTPEGGHLWLTVGREADEAVLRVRDTGVGIPADMLARVFDLFTQMDRSLDRSQGGLGVGLTVVKRLVELHGGGVTAHSSGANQGSEFVVRLPLLADMPPPEATAGPDGRAEPAPVHRILVVDDNADAAESLARVLELTGHEVRTVRDGPAALEAARTYRPAIVLLDIGLPGMDGYEVARRLREQFATATVRLVALTGYGREEDRRQSREAGFDDHLVKPVSPATLDEVLRSVAAPARSGDD